MSRRVYITAERNPAGLRIPRFVLGGPFEDDDYIEAGFAIAEANRLRVSRDIVALRSGAYRVTLARLGPRLGAVRMSLVSVRFRLERREQQRSRSSTSAPRNSQR